MDTKKLLLLFERPQEPVFTPKGDKKKTVFLTPPEYLNKRHIPYAGEIASRFGESADDQFSVPIISIPNMQDIEEGLRRDAGFSLFITKHRELASRLILIFTGVKTVSHLAAVAVYAREHVNPQLFSYAYAVALLHRPDTKNLQIPSIVHNFPDKFVQNTIIGRAREDITIVPKDNREPIEIPRDYTASDLEQEHRLAYFREDLGVNLHHWYWHQVYPNTGPMNVINKDRRGELFYYMHHQIIARYNMERLANNLPRVERLVDLRAPIKEAYFPKLDRLTSNRSYPGRVANSQLKSLQRSEDNSFVDIDDLERWRDTILSAIHAGEVVDTNNKKVRLDEFRGIDILGNIIEASDLSINKRLYGNLHNEGHNVISLVHDPDFRHKEEPGVMGDVATAMRDPIFYRWHAFIDYMLQQFKSSLPRYTVEQLNHPGVEITGIEVKSQGGQPNALNTFWQQSDVNIVKGLDFQRDDGDIFVRVTHLQHKDFDYTISVNNTSGGVKEGTCRIFLAPKADEKGVPWRFPEQKNLFIEMDKFKVNLKSGKNTISRSSTQSSVTIPFERIYRTDQPPEDEAEKAQYNFCGCGWPQNLLLPRGNAEGMSAQLFVMISNYDDDKIEQDISGQCNDAFSYCGLKDKLYPDRRSMGYPFDREPRDGVNTLQQFITPNMRVQDITIKYQNSVMAQVSAF